MIRIADRVLDIHDASDFRADALAIFQRDAGSRVNIKTQHRVLRARAVFEQQQFVAEATDHRLQQLLQTLLDGRHARSKNKTSDTASPKTANKKDPRRGLFQANILVAGEGFEPMTFGLCARRAASKKRKETCR